MEVAIFVALGVLIVLVVIAVVLKARAGSLFSPVQTANSAEYGLIKS